MQSYKSWNVKELGPLGPHWIYYYHNVQIHLCRPFLALLPFSYTYTLLSAQRLQRLSQLLHRRRHIIKVECRDSPLSMFLRLGNLDLINDGRLRRRRVMCVSERMARRGRVCRIAVGLRARRRWPRRGGRDVLVWGRRWDNARTGER